MSDKCEDIKEEIYENALERTLELNDGWHVESSLSLVVLSITSICNRSCNFCPLSQGVSIPECVPNFISMDTVKLLANQLGESFNGTILISGFGEPMLHPDFVSVVTTLGKMCPNSAIMVCTNGDYLTKEIVSLVALTKIFVSVYDVKNLSIFQHEYSHLKKVCFLNRTITGNFKVNNLAGNAYDLNNKQQKQCLLKICSLPFFLVTLDVDGSVYRCSCDWKREFPLGNIYEKEIKMIFLENFNKLRMKILKTNRSKLELCKKCDFGQRRYRMNGMHVVFINNWQEEISRLFYEEKLKD